MKARLNARAIGGHRRTWALWGLLAASATALSLLPASKTEAHGYIIGDAKSRAFLCSAEGGRLNNNCGPAERQPQSIQYFPSLADWNHYPNPNRGCPGRFNECGPADGWIASGGRNGWGAIDEQNATRWYKNRITPGEHTFTWYYTQGHPGDYHEFYITKKGWNPNQPLTRESFELVPVASFGPSDKPGNNVGVDFKINIPADYDGYHVLLAVWKEGNRSPGALTQFFYQVVDLDIVNDDVTQPEWNLIGAMNPEPLLPGDKVGVRVFTEEGEVLPQPSMLVIDSEEKGDPHVWSYGLATALNNTANIGFRTGLLDDQGQVAPNYGQNHFYVRPDSRVTRVEVVKYIADLPTTLRLSGLQDSYAMADGRVNLHYNALATGNETYTINTAVFRGGKQIAYKAGSVGNNAHFSMALENATPGTYDVTAVATANNQYKASASHRFTVVAESPAPEHDFVYPQGRDQYTGGTKVLQPKDGKIYECKPWPYEGWCGSTSDFYEPGKGIFWSEAWTEV